MTIGPGKYDDILTEVRERVEAAGGAALLVVGGKHGHGFSVQATLEATLMMAEVMESAAK